jgi:hypothetical protein
MANLKKELQHYKIRVEAETGVDKIINLEGSLKDAERRN